MTNTVAFLAPEKMTSDLTHLFTHFIGQDTELSFHPFRENNFELNQKVYMEAQSKKPTLVISTQSIKQWESNAVLPSPDVDKLTQFIRFIAYNIPTILTMPFQTGMTFPGEASSLVVLKPAMLNTWASGSLIVLRKDNLHRIKREHFPKDHPILKHPYVVQDFIETGSKSVSYRVVLFCGAPIIAYRIVGKNDIPVVTGDEICTGSEFISNGPSGYSVSLFQDPEMINVAVKMTASIDHPLYHPVLTKCDLLFDEKLGWRALEISNNDWNSWPLGRPNLIESLGKEKMINQFDAYKTISKKIEYLVDAVNSKHV